MNPTAMGTPGNPTWIGCAIGNWSVGRAGNTVEAVVIHLMDGSLVGTDAWFNTTPIARNNGGFASSAHYGIGKTGTVHQYVKREDRAFHAGRVDNPSDNAKWLTAKNPNYITIGIEHEGHVTDDWSDAMYASSAALVADIAKQYGFPIDRTHVVGHREIYAAKSCPGPKCDLDKIVAMALAIQAATIHAT